MRRKKFPFVILETIILLCALTACHFGKTEVTTAGSTSEIAQAPASYCAEENEYPTEASATDHIDESTEIMSNSATDNERIKSYPETDLEGDYYSYHNPFDITNIEHKKYLTFYFDFYDFIDDSDYAYHHEYTYEDYEKMNRDLFYLIYQIPIDSSKISRSQEYEYKLHENGKIEITKYFGKETVVNIPNQINGYEVIYIGEEAFAEQNMESVTMPDTIIYIDDTAFGNCTNLKNVKLSENLIAISNSFVGCSSLKEIELPIHLEYIYAGSFEQSGITHIVFPPSLKIIGGYAFLENKDLSRVEFNDGLQFIDINAFSHSGLTEVTIPESVINLSCAFDYCEQLKSVYFPKHMLSDIIIHEHTFEDCPNLSAVEFPDNVSEIREYAFGSCRSLKEVTLPASLHTLGDFAFSKSGVKDVIFQSADCEFGTGVFEACFGLKIHAPAGGSVEKYCRNEFLIKYVPR